MFLFLETLSFKILYKTLGPVTPSKETINNRIGNDLGISCNLKTKNRSTIIKSVDIKILLKIEIISRTLMRTAKYRDKDRNS